MLFPDSVAVEMARLPTPAETLFPEEEAVVARALAKRRREFAAGRWCARRALARLGIGAVAIAAGVDREPLWPIGVVGSIAHSDAWAIAAVTTDRSIRSLGVDLEPDAPLEEELWTVVCRPEERRWLATQPLTERGRLVRLLFSAKEAIYKASFPIDRTALEFHDASVAVDLAGGSFAATIIPPLGAQISLFGPLYGRFELREGMVVCGVVL